MYCFNNDKTQKSESFKNLHGKVATNRRKKTRNQRKNKKFRTVLSASLGHCLEMGNAKNGKNNQYIHQQMQGMENTKEGKSTL